MAEAFRSVRLIFSKKGEQREFIIKAKHSIGLDWNELSKLLNISVRTLKDWMGEKFSISHDAVRILSNKANLKLPKNTKVFDLKNHLKNISNLGGKAVYKKYGYIGGDKIQRVNKWKQWWIIKGQFKDIKILQRKKINIPLKNKLLAEFVGIMLGDGGISDHQVSITLNKKDDYIYSLFISNLIRKLFSVKPRVKFRKIENALDLIVSRKNLVDFCASIGLKIGNKLNQDLDIPLWINKNVDLKIACLRGLIDTDGCCVIHKYKVKNKSYCYKKISFSSSSPHLIESVISILKELGFSPRLSYNRNNVWLDGRADVQRYFKLVKTHNPKHKERYLR